MSRTTLVDLRTAITTAQRLASTYQYGHVVPLHPRVQATAQLICALFELETDEDNRLMRATIAGLWTVDHALESYRDAGRIPGGETPEPEIQPEPDDQGCTAETPCPERAANGGLSCEH